jgi:hypothetical protein
MDRGGTQVVTCEGSRDGTVLSHVVITYVSATPAPATRLRLSGHYWAATGASGDDGCWRAVLWCQQRYSSATSNQKTLFETVHPPLQYVSSLWYMNQQSCVINRADFQADAIWAASPTTNRGQPTPLSSDPKGERIAYAVRRRFSVLVMHCRLTLAACSLTSPSSSGPSTTPPSVNNTPNTRHSHL